MGVRAGRRWRSPGRRSPRPARVAREGRGRRGLGVPRQPDQAAHGLQGLDRVWPLQDDDDRARQVQGRHPVPPRQRPPQLRDRHHRRRPRDARKAKIAFGSASSRTGTTRRRTSRRSARRPRGRRAAAPEDGEGEPGPAPILGARGADRRAGGQEHLGRGHGHERHRSALEPARAVPNDPRILWIVALDLTDNTYGNATGIGSATSRRASSSRRST